MLRVVLLTVALFIGISGRLVADLDGIVVIAHPDSQVTSITRVELSKIFLRRLRTWENGVRAVPVDQSPDSGTRGLFSRQVLRRSVVNVEVFWKRMIFSGRSVPPPEVEGDKAVLEFVRSTPGAVGYVSASAEHSGVVEVAVRD